MLPTSALLPQPTAQLQHCQPEDDGDDQQRRDNQEDEDLEPELHKEEEVVVIEEGIKGGAQEEEEEEEEDDSEEDPGRSKRCVGRGHLSKGSSPTASFSKTDCGEFDTASANVRASSGPTFRRSSCRRPSRTCPSTRSSWRSSLRRSTRTRRRPCP